MKNQWYRGAYRREWRRTWRMIENAWGPAGKRTSQARRARRRSSMEIKYREWVGELCSTKGERHNMSLEK